MKEKTIDNTYTHNARAPQSCLVPVTQLHSVFCNRGHCSVKEHGIGRHQEHPVHTPLVPNSHEITTPVVWCHKIEYW
jgi:hypothetical protein